MGKVQICVYKKNTSFMFGKSPGVYFQEKHQPFEWEKSGSVYTRKTHVFLDEKSLGVGPVPSMDIQTSLALPPQKWCTFHERYPQCWNDWKIEYQIFPNFTFWVMADCVYNLRWHTRIFKCVTGQKKICLKVAKFTGKMRNDLKRMGNQFSDF